jgi:hypothetical protein
VLIAQREEAEADYNESKGQYMKRVVFAQILHQSTAEDGEEYNGREKLYTGANR